MQLSSLRIIGEGPIAADHSLKNVEWLGWLSPSKVIQEIREARALVFPSIWNETFGLTAYETMAHGVPVVVSDCTAAAGYIENGDSNRKVLGWMNHASLYEKMKSFSFLVFPSRWYEGQPLVVLEALSMGIPVICSDSCAAKEAIIEGKNGFLFRSGDHVDLREKIQMILDHGKLKDMSIYAYDYFWNNYPDNDKHISDLIGIYQKVLGI